MIIDCVPEVIKGFQLKVILSQEQEKMESLEQSEAFCLQGLVKYTLTSLCETLSLFDV